MTQLCELKIQLIDLCVRLIVKSIFVMKKVQKTTTKSRKGLLSNLMDTRKRKQENPYG